MNHEKQQEDQNKNKERYYFIHTCELYGKKEHMKPNCPRNQNQRRNQKKKKSSRKPTLSGMTMTWNPQLRKNQTSVSR